MQLPCCVATENPQEQGLEVSSKRCCSGIWSSWDVLYRSSLETAISDVEMEMNALFSKLLISQTLQWWKALQHSFPLLPKSAQLYLRPRCAKRETVQYYQGNSLCRSQPNFTISEKATLTIVLGSGSPLFIIGSPIFCVRNYKSNK